MGLECMIVVAHAFGRTLVVPPQQHLYLLGQTHQGTYVHLNAHIHIVLVLVHISPPSLLFLFLFILVYAMAVCFLVPYCKLFLFPPF